ncbi:MAG: peptide deformylase [Roseburia sp.]|nr:peptide deformylase [Anaeroplasma bactoclasticum]MCM1196846.1 peptide deformylase [Roseburia sp.]MCM1557044.1 peptide deformylase [Anaeroplasma bactoclasticum]
MYLNKDIVKEGNQILRNESAKVSLPLSNADFNCLKGLYEYVVISSMDELVKQYDIRPGVGIAAPQVGVNKRMFAMNAVDFLDEKQPRYLFAIINPTIIQKSKEMTYLPGGEGCLSVDRSTDGLVTPRHYAITAKCSIYDFNTNKIKTVTLKLEGYPAIVFQHEYDHLDGILYTDKMYASKELDSNVFPLYEETEE